MIELREYLSFHGQGEEDRVIATFDNITSAYNFMLDNRIIYKFDRVRVCLIKAIVQFNHKFYTEESFNRNPRRSYALIRTSDLPHNPKKLEDIYERTNE